MAISPCDLSFITINNDLCRTMSNIVRHTNNIDRKIWVHIISRVMFQPIILIRTFRFLNFRTDRVVSMHRFRHMELMHRKAVIVAKLYNFLGQFDRDGQGTLSMIHLSMSTCLLIHKLGDSFINLLV